MEIISIREFAKRVNVDHSSIREAMSNGRISDAAISDGKIKYEIAIKEWEAIGGGNSANKSVPELPAEDTTPGDTIHIRKNASLSEAKRVEAIAKAKLAQIELEKTKGSLVEKKEVYKELFAVGQEIRSALQGIPDKYIDNILACSTRSESHAMLFEAITEALAGLSKKIEL